MPTPAAIISTVSALMNDSAQSRYTNSVCLPYLNLALDELQELYELNGIPIINKTSAIISVPSGVSSIGYTTIPAIPSDLIEIQELWESPSGQNEWTHMNKKEFIPHYLEDNTTISQFLIWSWESAQIKLIAANANNDLKLDYIAFIFNTPILMASINVDLSFTNIKTYLEYKTAAICAMFVAENETRAMALNGLAGTALDRALGIPIKGMQSIITRRRPFRASFKTRNNVY